MEAKTLALPASTVVDKLQAFGAPCSVMNNVSQLLDDEQVASVRIVQPLPIDQGDGHRVVGVPFTLNGQRMDQHVAPPALGEHTQRLLTEAGYSADAIEALHARRVIG